MSSTDHIIWCRVCKCLAQYESGRWAPDNRELSRKQAARLNINVGVCSPCYYKGRERPLYRTAAQKAEPTVDTIHEDSSPWKVWRDE